MALVKLGPIVEEASGSESGTTFSRNRYGAYTRKRTTPVNPSSSRQQTIRNIFAAVAANWSDVLTDAQRAAWNLYGNSVVMQNALGQSIYLTGFAHYIRSNVARYQAVAVYQNDGPTDFTLPASDPVYAVTASEATQLLSVVFDDTMDWCDENGAFMSITMSQPRNPSRDFIGGPYRFADSIDGDGTTPPTSPQTIACPFAIAEDQKIEVVARIEREDGRLSEPFRTTIDAAA